MGTKLKKVLIKRCDDSYFQRGLIMAGSARRGLYNLVEVMF